MKLLTGMLGFVGTLMFVMAAFQPSQAQITTEQAQQGKVLPRNGWRVIETTMAIDELLDSLKKAIREEDMLLVSMASASRGAKANGFEIPGNYVIGVFRNDFARRMLAASVQAGIEAPVRFYLTENPDGTATLSWKTPSFVFQPYRATASEDLVSLSEELDVIFQRIADRATDNT
ncbi:hypothetical protein PsAD46_00801 [Pseudovibrio sp. Ad46]|uniref:DUF302 domain-containing protein n=1 Tax=unclassified Pseudovibrio TaxID=2627060 RepID=UPI0007AE47AB|nr:MULTISPECIES: DUF302 domain-containing protein [unclassified Pseudovibrio]KZK95785.1 hypothetical protein PsAD46_00801 [Pseudovibrio sp. Ad46]KZL00256.1 hypothetical protein PsW74_02677 [Pseudovibrio sp. W74]KZL11653.1 hypothetical protein PsAD14_00804 [Pseudovibrio sp. Ad14]